MNDIHKIVYSAYRRLNFAQKCLAWLRGSDTWTIDIIWWWWCGVPLALPAHAETNEKKMHKQTPTQHILQLHLSGKHSLEQCRPRECITAAHVHIIHICIHNMYTTTCHTQCLRLYTVFENVCFFLAQHKSLACRQLCS